MSHDESVDGTRVKALLEGYIMLLRLFADAIREVGSFRSLPRGAKPYRYLFGTFQAKASRSTTLCTVHVSSGLNWCSHRVVLALVFCIFAFIGIPTVIHELSCMHESFRLGGT